MQRIMIIGSPGCGKTTLARQLSQMLQLPLIHLDQLNWRDDWNPVSKDQFDSLLSAEVKKPFWIIDGNFGRTISLRLSHCDTVIYMDYPRTTCLFRVVKRVVTNYGKSRPEMGGNCPERFDAEFLKFIWNFQKQNRTRYYKMLSDMPGIRVIVLKNSKETARFLHRMKARAR